MCTPLLFAVTGKVVLVSCTRSTSESIPFHKLCAWRHNMPPPSQVDNSFALTRQVAALFQHNNIFIFIRQVAPVPIFWLFKDITNKLTFDHLTLKVMSESRVTWATSVPMLVFLGLSVLELNPMYATDRQTDVRQKHRLMPPPYGGRGIITSSQLCCSLYLIHLRTPTR